MLWKKLMICIHLLCDMTKGGKTGLVEILLLTKLGFQIFYLLHNKTFYFGFCRLNINSFPFSLQSCCNKSNPHHLKVDFVR